MANKRSYTMRVAVSVLFGAHLITNAVTLQVNALNPAMRIPAERYQPPVFIRRSKTLQYCY